MGRRKRNTNIIVATVIPVLILLIGVYLTVVSGYSTGFSIGRNGTGGMQSINGPEVIFIGVVLMLIFYPIMWIVKKDKKLWDEKWKNESKKQHHKNS